MLAKNIRSISKSGVRTLVDMGRYNNPNSKAPLVEKYRPLWPDVDFTALSKGETEDVSLLPRTVDPTKLTFDIKMTLKTGTSVFYPHLKTNPADCKVALTVALKDLNLNEDERDIFFRMVGPRYNPVSQILKLTCAKFGNRIENKKYVTHMLEDLLKTTRELNVLYQSKYRLDAEKK